MADIGHELTDELLKDLEERVKEEYRKALTDAEKKLSNWLKKFTKADEEQKALLEAGQISETDYKNWRFRHIMMGREWIRLRDTIASDFHNANQIAIRMARETMPDVYALNMNYGTYNIEHDGKIDTGFSLYNHDAAEHLMRETELQLMPGPSDKKAALIAADKDLQWNYRHIQSAVLSGVLLGESPYDVARRLQSVAQMNYNSAVRYSRTMTTAAQNAGRYEAFRRANKLGVDLTIEWQATLDHRTRHDHRLMHGQRVAVDEPFHTPDGFTIMWPADCTSSVSNAPQGEIWNCRCTLLSWVKGFEGNTVKSSPKMGDMSFEEWQNAKAMTKEEQEAWIKAGMPSMKDWENSPLRRMAINMRSDKEQFERYREVLGNLAPNNFTSFQRMKYNSDGGAWSELKLEYRRDLVLRNSHFIARINRDGEVLNPMPKEEYDRIKSSLERLGRSIRPVLQSDSDDAFEYMTRFGFEAVYENGQIRHLGAIPSRGVLYEEIIHMTQARKYGEIEGGDEIERFAREVEAARKLLLHKEAYRLDDADISAIERSLEYYEKRFLNEFGVSYDESNYRG